MIGLVIGWSWRPRWSGLVFLGFRSKFRFLWSAPPGFGARRLWFAFTAVSAFSVGRRLWCNYFFKAKRQESDPEETVLSLPLPRPSPPSSRVDTGEQIFPVRWAVSLLLSKPCLISFCFMIDTRTRGTMLMTERWNVENNFIALLNFDFHVVSVCTIWRELIYLGLHMLSIPFSFCFCSPSVEAPKELRDIVTEKDLDHLLYLLEGKVGDIAWQSMMERTTPSMAYQAWRHEPEVPFGLLLWPCFNLYLVLHLW